MSKIKHLEFTESETWTVHLAARNANGQPYDLTDGAAEWAFGIEGGATLLTFAGTIVDAADGFVDFILSPAAHAALTAGEYVHEMRVILTDLSVSTQVRGRLTVTASP